MKKFPLLIILFLSGIFNLSAQSDKDIILGILEKQRQDWNRGSIEDYMKGYWKSDSLIFVGSGGITYGYAQTLSNYKKSYSDTSLMGELSFDILYTEKISEDRYFVVGKWHIKRNSGNISGHFTLVLRKINGEWKIVADHSS